MPKRQDKHKRKQGWIGWMQYIGLRLFTALVQSFPISWNYVTCRVIGDLMFFLDHRHRDRAERHIQLSFPDWPKEKVSATARESMRSMVYLGLEVLYTPRLITPRLWRKHIILGENMHECVRLLIERKKGLLLLTGHFGNWEVLGYLLGTLGLPTVSVARRLDNPHIDEFVLGVREKTGQRILDKKGAAKEMHGLLTDNEAIGFIADQDAGRRGMFVDFFGRKASAYKTIALLAIRYEIPVVCGCAIRQGAKYEFEIGAGRIIYPHEWADADDPVRWITQAYTSALEGMIRHQPGQYLWVHRRWKHRPKGEEQPKDGIA
ncbi:MAG: lysophospholipid acyltransferase family protein [Phycisphaerae bacterium]